MPFSKNMRRTTLANILLNKIADLKKHYNTLRQICQVITSRAQVSAQTCYMISTENGTLPKQKSMAGS